MIKQFTLLVAPTLLVALGAVPPAAAGLVTAHSAQQGTAAVCNKVKVTGSRVALREFAFTNAQVLSVVPRGTTLTSCGIEHPNGSGYTKCGRVGYDWHRVTTRAGQHRLRARDLRAPGLEGATEHGRDGGRTLPAYLASIHIKQSE